MCKKIAMKTVAGKVKFHKKTKASRAGLKFPVKKFHKYFKEESYGNKVVQDAPVLMEAILEYLIVETLEFARNPARDNKKTKISS
jgi:hypothetical protein